MEMGVVNVRKDLFPWYGNQGYSVIERINDYDAFSILVRPDMDTEVFCVLMRKELVL
jgi:hypothetical protein